MAPNDVFKGTKVPPLAAWCGTVAGCSKGGCGAPGRRIGRDGTAYCGTHLFAVRNQLPRTDWTASILRAAQLLGISDPRDICRDVVEARYARLTILVKGEAGDEGIRRGKLMSETRDLLMGTLLH